MIAPDEARAGDRDIRARLTTAGRGNVLMTVAAMAASLITQAWLARATGPEGLGTYAATSLFITVLSTLVALGTPVAGSQRIAHLDEHRDSRVREATAVALALGLVVGSVAAMVGAVSWPTFARLVRLPETAPIALIGVAVLSSVFANSVVNVLLAKLRMGAASALVLVQPLAVGIGLFLGPATFGPSTLAAVGFIGSGAAATLWTISDRNRPWLHAGETRVLLRATLPATAALYPQILTSWVDRAIVGLLAGPAVLGAYTAASAVAEGLLRVPRNLGMFAIPAYARLASDAVGVRRVLDSHLRIVSAFFIVTGTAFMAGASGIVTLIFGEPFAPATTAMQLLLISIVPAGVSLTLIASAVGTGRQRGSVRMLVLLVPLQIVTTTVATAFISIAGTALSQVIVWSVGVVLFFSQSRPEHDPAIIRTIARIAGIGTPLWLAARFLGTLTFAWPLRGALMAALSAGVVALFLVGAPEVRIVRRLLARAAPDAHESDAPL